MRKVVSIAGFVLLVLCLAPGAFASPSVVDPAPAGQELAVEAEEIQLETESSELFAVPATLQDGAVNQAPDFLGTGLFGEPAILGCGFPPPPPPPGCNCGGCCECNRCWQGGHWAKCFSY